jgi:glycosyltransferase involved in cell wall biosynthesis
VPAPLLLDLSHTCHTRARTGIQRVSRALRRELGAAAQPVTHDPYAGVWRPLALWEEANLTAPGSAGRRGARWPWSARARGWLAAALRAGRPPTIERLRPNAGLLVPEVFSPAVAAALPGLLAAADGPAVAVFHDAIALQHPELSPPGTVARFPAYLLELLSFDGVAAVSEASRDALCAYWAWQGIRDYPPVVAIPLGVDVPAVVPVAAAAAPVGPPEVLCVGSLEGRKNHLALLEAAERLWREGVAFRLRLIGIVQPATGAAAARRVAELQAAGFPLLHEPGAGDAAVAAAYAACAFTVYPSRVEGFGLPVLESLAHGKPCVCAGRGALGETARGGGCLALDDPGPEALAAGLRRLLTDSSALAALVAAARARPIRRWADHAADLVAWQGGLARRRRDRLPFRLP